MKKTVVTIFCPVICTISLFVSCKTTNHAEKVNTENSVVLSTSLTRSSQTKKIYDPDPYNDEKMKGEKGSFMEQMFGTDKCLKIDTTTLYVHLLPGAPKNRKVQLIYKPQFKMPGFMVRYDTGIYAIYLGEEDRDKLIAAVSSYLSDFENKNLDTNTKKAQLIYGEGRAYEEFGSLEATLFNYSKPKTAFGYRFLDDKPFFCIKFNRSPNLSEEMGTYRNPESIDQLYYFTRKQAQHLAEFLSEENVAYIEETYIKEQNNSEIIENPYKKEDNGSYKEIDE